MRILLAAAISLSPAFGWADSFTTDSAVIAAKVFPNGASVARQAAIDLPAGAHRIILNDIPRDLSAGSLQVGVASGAGLSVTAMNVRADRTVPVEPVKTPQMVQAEQALQQAQSALDDLRQQRAEFQGNLSSALLRIKYLESLAGGGGVMPHDAAGALPADLAAAVGAMGAQMAQATADKTTARAALGVTERQLAELEDAVERARQTLRAVTPLRRATATLFVDLLAQQPYQGPLQVTYLDRNASWSPTYDLHLAQSDAAGALQLIRQAVVRQGTGEDWADVALTLSTADLAQATQVYIPDEMVFWLEDEDKVSLMSRATGEARKLGLAEPAMEESVAGIGDGFVSGAQTALRGQTLEFELAAPASVDGDWGEKLLRLDAMERQVDLYALANARGDRRAFLYTDFENDTGGTLLAGRTAIYRDGTLVGYTNLPQTANGDRAELPLGALNGVLLEHRILSAQAGDSGFVRASDTRTERFELQIDSTLDYAIDLTVYEAMPVSEDEDLKVRVNAVPAPTVEAVEGRRGVVGWKLALPADASRKISYGWTLRWPEDQNLRQRPVPLATR